MMLFRIGVVYVGRPVVLSPIVKHFSTVPAISANEIISKARSSKFKSNIAGNKGRNNSNPLILCKRAEFNHYPGQSYAKFDAIPLASVGWQHRKAKGDYFILNNTTQYNEPRKSEGIPFTSTGISAELVNALDRLGIIEPTSIQAKGIPVVLSGNNTLLAAETGCGKTFSYLLPLLHQIQTWKPLLALESAQLNSPLGLIITPSRELSYQITDVARQLTQDIPIACKLLVGGRTKAKMLNPDFEQVDLLVATLGALSKLTTTGIYNMTSVRHVVLDEADTLLDDSFNDKLKFFLKKFPFRFGAMDNPNEFPSGAQLTLASATMPMSLPETLSEIILPQSLQKVATDNLHGFLSHVPQKFLRLGRSDKPGQLLSILKNKTNAPTIVFSNKSSTSDWVSMFLKENNVDCVNLNGDMPYVVRSGKFKHFQSGQVNILSCTDIASRGLDTIKVQHIINYDFPLYTADYIHRCGRTGRVGSPSACQVTNFIAGPREVDLAQKIEMAARKSDFLPYVNANISKVIHDRIQRNMLKEQPPTKPAEIEE